MDEILVKGQDEKWYILRGEELVPYGGLQTTDYRLQTPVKEGPKGVSEERHERVEKTEDRRQKTEIVGVIRPPSSVLRPPASHAEHPVAKELEELMDRVVREVQEGKEGKEGIDGAKGWDEVMRKRFRTIVSARLRDVRDSAETRAMLKRDRKVGGMGMGTWEQGNMETIVGIIEKAFGEFQRKWREAETRRMEEWKMKQREQLQQRDQQEQLKSQQELEQRYKKLVGDKEVVPSRAEAAPATPPPKPPTPSLPTSPQPPQPPPKPYTLTPRPPGKITDVRPAPKSLGPIEELGSLTLEDFRRLPGNSASGRAQKVLSRIEFLGQESLARRAKGIAAWRASPLNQLYVGVLSDAFSRGASPESALQDKPTLTAEEFRAIMEINQKLRF